MKVRDKSGNWSISIHKGEEKVLKALSETYPDLEIKRMGEYYNLEGEKTTEDNLDTLLNENNKKAENEYFIRTFVDFDDADELRT